MSNFDYLIESGDFRTGQIFQRARLDKGLSVNQLALKVGCTRNNLYMIENLESQPSMKLFIKLCRVLKIDPEKLVINFLREHQE